jgi:peptidyl-prolyl cis-trans isomerase SurA
VKRRILVFGAAMAVLGGAASSEAITDRIVAVVNQEIIMLSEVEKGMQTSGEGAYASDRLEKLEQLKQIRQKILNQLVEDKLIDLESKKLGLKASAREMDTAIEDIRQRNNLSQEELEKAVENQGLTFEAFKKELERKIVRSKLVQFSVKVDSDFKDRELRDFYDKNIDRYRSNERYRPAHILLRVPGGKSPEEIQEIRVKCQKILERLKRGEDFGEMALLYSEDPTSKDRGDLGYFRRGELVSLFEKEALRLRVGEVGEIIKTDFGFHIIKLLEREGGAPAPYEDVKDKVKADYYESQMEKALKQFLTALRDKSVVEIRL